jgi:hypothetical protein
MVSIGCGQNKLGRMHEKVRFRLLIEAYQSNCPTLKPGLDTRSDLANGFSIVEQTDCCLLKASLFIDSVLPGLSSVHWSV